MRQRLRISLYVTVVLAGLSCSTQRLVEAVLDLVASIDVEPKAYTLGVGNSVQLLAIPRDSSGSPLAERPVTWSSSNTAIARVTAAGLVTAAATGVAYVVATSEGKSDSSTITATAIQVGSVTVAPTTASVDVGRTVQLQATVRDTDGSVLTDRVVVWASSNTSVAQVSTSGVVTGIGAGSASVTASSEGQSGSAAITVTMVPVATLTVTPTSASIETNKTVQLTATLRDATGATLTGRTVTWTSLNSAVATVSSSGLVTGVTAGSANVYALSEGKSDTAAITVVAPPPPPPPPPPGALPAFPGAQGFGTTTRGGRGGAIIRVTNLNDTGEGSLRAALAASGPRIIIFEVSGEIRVGANLVISQPYVTVAGQTAPSPGITLRGGTLRINAHDVVIQHLRFRPGDEPGASRERDGIEFYGGSLHKYNVVIDHCSISWGVDENLSTGTYSSGVRHDITFSNLIISEGLNNSIHPEGAHSKGVLIGQGSTNITFMGNVMAHHVDRSPWFKGHTSGMIVNNVIYNWGGSKATYFDDVDDTEEQFASVVGNVFLRGVNSPSSSYAIRVYDGVQPGSLFYMADNSLDRAAPPSNPWTLVNNEAGSSVVATTPQSWIDGLVHLPNGNVESWVLGNAGARPADRDAVDLRIVQEVRNGTGRIIDHPSDVGGWPVLAENYRALTPPANPNGDDDGDGYTNVEEWLHQMAAEVEGRVP